MSNSYSKLLVTKPSTRYTIILAKENSNILSYLVPVLAVYYFQLKRSNRDWFSLHVGHI